MQEGNTEKETEMVEMVSDLSFQIRVAERCAKSRNLIYLGMKQKFDQREETEIGM